MEKCTDFYRINGVFIKLWGFQLNECQFDWVKRKTIVISKKLRKIGKFRIKSIKFHSNSVSKILICECFWLDRKLPATQAPKTKSNPRKTAVSFKNICRLLTALFNFAKRWVFEICDVRITSVQVNRCACKNVCTYSKHYRRRPWCHHRRLRNSVDVYPLCWQMLSKSGCCVDLLYYSLGMCLCTVCAQTINHRRKTTQCLHNEILCECKFRVCCYCVVGYGVRELRRGRRWRRWRWAKCGGISRTHKAIVHHRCAMQINWVAFSSRCCSRNASHQSHKPRKKTMKTKVRPRCQYWFWVYNARELVNTRTHTRTRQPVG